MIAALVWRLFKWLIIMEVMACDDGNLYSDHDDLNDGKNSWFTFHKYEKFHPFGRSLPNSRYCSWKREMEFKIQIISEMPKIAKHQWVRMLFFPSKFTIENIYRIHWLHCAMATEADRLHQFQVLAEHPQVMPDAKDVCLWLINWRNITKTHKQSMKKTHKNQKTKPYIVERYWKNTTYPNFDSWLCLALVAANPSVIRGAAFARPLARFMPSIHLL